jgi:hypothetical protein
MSKIRPYCEFEIPYFDEEGPEPVAAVRMCKKPIVRYFYYEWDQGGWAGNNVFTTCQEHGEEHCIRQFGMVGSKTEEITLDEVLVWEVMSS